MKNTHRLINYLITGGAWFWSGYAMFALLYGVFGLDIITAKIASYIFGLLVNFLLERFWVFAAQDAAKQLDKVGVRYVLLSGVNLGIDTAIVWSLNKAGITPYIGQFISAGFFTVWNYIWYSLWVFAKKAAPGPKRPAAPALKRPKHVQYKRKGKK
jgi:putative flippase GtrA